MKLYRVTVAVGGNICHDFETLVVADGPGLATRIAVDHARESFQTPDVWARIGAVEVPLVEGVLSVKEVL